MKSKTVFISGGTKGIGRAVVESLLSQGFNVSTFSRNNKNIIELESKLNSKFAPSKYLVLNADVTDEESIDFAVSESLKKFNTIDILINNAGFGYFSSVDNFDNKQFLDLLNVNLFGLALVTKKVVPVFKKHKKGQIINIASISGKVAFPWGEFYSATKFGVMGYSQAIREELREFGIKVSTICPGMVDTDFFDEKELKRRMKIWGGVKPTMLKTKDITDIISLICNQSSHSDIQDLTIMPFG